MRYCTKWDCGTIKFIKKMDMYINFDYNPVFDSFETIKLQKP